MDRLRGVVLHCLGLIKRAALASVCRYDNPTDKGFSEQLPTQSSRQHLFQHDVTYSQNLWAGQLSSTQVRNTTSQRGRMQASPALPHPLRHPKNPILKGRRPMTHIRGRLTLSTTWDSTNSTKGDYFVTLVTKLYNPLSHNLLTKKGHFSYIFPTRNG